MEILFDISHDYDDMLNKGIRLSGENKFYFIKGRITDLKNQLPKDFTPNNILDFGCGIGDTTKILSKAFSNSIVIGTDLSNNALNYAKNKYNTDRIKFVHLNNLKKNNYFELCYVNGVFHHIDPNNRIAVFKMIYNLLKAGGYFSIFENNPWNIGTQIVMSRIPFDKNAKMLNHLSSRKYLKETGFVKINKSRFLFYFPKFLSFLRFLEHKLVHFPFGAQYYILAKK